MHNKIATLLLILAIALPVFGTPPKVEPIDQSFDRFCKECIPQAEALLSQLRVSYSGEGMDPSGDVDVLLGYLHNITADDIPGIRRGLAEASNRPLPYWLMRVETDLAGFRRTVDHLIIINLMNNRLPIEDSFRKKLDEFWKTEQYFSKRFRHEVDRRLNLPAD